MDSERYSPWSCHVFVPEVGEANEYNEKNPGINIPCGLADRNLQYPPNLNVTMSYMSDIK